MHVIYIRSSVAPWFKEMCARMLHMCVHTVYSRITVTRYDQIDISDITLAVIRVHVP